MDKLSNQGLVLVIKELIIVLQIIMSPLVNIMLNNGLQLLKLFLLMSLNIQHLEFILSFLLKSLLFERLNLLLHLMIFLFNLFAISLFLDSLFLDSLFVNSLLDNSILDNSLLIADLFDSSLPNAGLFVIFFDRRTIFLTAFSFTLLGRRIIRA